MRSARRAWHGGQATSRFVFSVQATNASWSAGLINHIQVPRRKFGEAMVSGTETRSGGRSRQAHQSGFAGAAQQPVVMPCWRGQAHGIRQRTCALSNVATKTEKEKRPSDRRAAEYSGTVAEIRGRREMLRPKVIGRTIAIGRGDIVALGLVGDGNSTLTLFDQPTGQVRGGGFLKPLIEQLGDLFFEIGGVRQARELVGLQSVARCRQQKFPGSLGAKFGHLALPKQAAA